MIFYDWNNVKNEQLKKIRGISFEQITTQIETGFLLDIVGHPNQEKYLNQRIYIVEYENYAYLVPFVQNKNSIFLKTIYPSRKATIKYLR
ncbi:MAG: toxin [candidate division KSB1 bacterium]|nr:toxin [candidate division KSB1 bacterium]